MDKSIQIVPAILATTEEEYKDKLQRIEKSGEFEGSWVQIDLMDNKFVPNQSIGADIIKKYPTDLRLEAQLMVVDPVAWIRNLKDFPISRFIAPIELNRKNLDDFIDEVRTSTDAEIGFSINPETPVEELGDYKDIADALLIMSVSPGFGGQAFIPESVQKVKEASSLKKDNNLNFLIGVDGGVNEQVAKDLASSGANYLVIGSHLINGDITENLEKIWQSFY